MARVRTRPRPRPGSPLLIQGDFRPGRGIRLLRVAALFLGAILLAGILVALTINGLRLHYESGIQAIGQRTRQLNEENKALQVRLNRIQSFQNVAAAASAVPHLQVAESVLEVTPEIRDARLPGSPDPTPSVKAHDSLTIYGY